MRKAGRAVDPGDDVIEPDAGEDRHAVPRRLAMGGHLVAAARELLAHELAQRLVGDLRLLEADDVRPALIEPRQQPRYALLEGVDVPGRDAPGRQRRPA